MENNIKGGDQCCQQLLSKNMKPNKTVEVTEKWLNSLIEQAKLTNDLLITIIDDNRVPLSSREVGILSRFIGQAQSAELLLPKHDDCDPETDLHGDLIVKSKMD